LALPINHVPTGDRLRAVNGLGERLDESGVAEWWAWTQTGRRGCEGTKV